jgi:hypothetical protein
MRRSTSLLAALAAAASLLGMVALPSSVSAQSIDPVTVTGVATCGHAGPVGRITLTWTVTNGTGHPLSVTSPAPETGTVDGSPYTGSVTLTPTQIPLASPGNVATGSDGPIGGTSTGSVTLTVAWSYINGEFPVTGSSPGTIMLPGDCVNPTPTTAVTTTTAKSAVVPAAVVSSPRFTG